MLEFKLLQIIKCGCQNTESRKNKINSLPFLLAIIIQDVIFLANIWSVAWEAVPGQEEKVEVYTDNVKYEPRGVL
jgi:hypothetical protein